MLCEKATQWREGILYENKSHKKIQEFKGQEIRCEYLWKYRCQGNFHAQPLWWNFTTWKLEQDWSALNTKWYFQRFLCQQQKTLPDIFQIYIAMHDSAKINQNTSLTLQKICILTKWYLELYLSEFANLNQTVGPPSIYGVPSHFLRYWVIYQWKKRLKWQKPWKQENWKFEMFPPLDITIHNSYDPNSSYHDTSKAKS